MFTEGFNDTGNWDKWTLKEYGTTDVTLGVTNGEGTVDVVTGSGVGSVVGWAAYATGLQLEEFECFYQFSFDDITNNQFAGLIFRYDGHATAPTGYTVAFGSSSATKLNYEINSFSGTTTLSNLTTGVVSITSVVAGDLISIRIRVVGETVLGRAWKSTDSEPTAWGIIYHGIAQQATNYFGLFGEATVADNTNSYQFDNFAVWPHSGPYIPTVTAVTNAYGSTTTPADPFVTGTFTPQYNCYYLLIVGNAVGDANTPTVTSSTGLSFSLIETLRQNSRRLSVWEAYGNTSVTSGTVTVDSVTADTSIVYCLLEIANVSMTDATQLGTAMAATNSVTSQTVTFSPDTGPRFGQSFRVAYALSNLNSAISVEAGWTSITNSSQTVATPNMAMVAAWRLDHYDATCTFSGASGTYFAGGIELLLHEPDARPVQQVRQGVMRAGSF